MPIDRNKTNNGRPLMPTLASSRTAKTPLTPRLAGPTSQPNQPYATIRSNRSDVSAVKKKPSREELAPSAKPYLSNNVTPRSTTRTTRIGGGGSGHSTPNGTPSGTPTGTRPASMLDTHPRERNGAGGLNVQMEHGRPRSTVGGGYPFVKSASRGNSVVSGVGREEPSSRDNSMFFRASDARTPEPTLAPAPSLKKASTFCYADGKEEPTQNRSSPLLSPPLSAVDMRKQQAPTQSQFFYAGTKAQNQPQTFRSAPPLPTSPEPLLSPSINKGPEPRAPSPDKVSIHLSYRKGASQVIKPRPTALSLYPHGNASASNVDTLLMQRKTSSGSRLGHDKRASISSIDSVNSPPQRGAHTSDHSAPPLGHSKLVPDATTRPSPVLSVSHEASPDYSHLDISSSPQSPSYGISAGGNLQSLSELAANARRERKVLDLEISNSSLLAINRQLEREVRKQKAELRRYRRLTRAGRFPSGSTFSVSGVGDSLGGEGEGEYEDASILDEDADSDEIEEDEEEGDLSHSSLSDSTTDEELLSPDALAERDSQRIFKDEQRLQLDLSKHRQLLVDSQKMNQSLKRCLGWTEELIKEGKKALEYKVRVSDVKLGGRVLTGEEITERVNYQNKDGEDSEDEELSTELGGALLSPWTSNDPMDELIVKREVDFGASVTSEKTDRDSGIDLEGLPPHLDKLLGPG